MSRIEDIEMGLHAPYESGDTVGKSDVDALVMCQWFGCKQPATVRIKRASTCVCDDHYLDNVLQFGCEFETEPVNQSGT